jgi:hypothetical protein
MNKEKEKAFEHGRTYDQRLLLSIESLLKEILDELKAMNSTGLSDTDLQQKQMLLEGYGATGYYRTDAGGPGPSGSGGPMSDNRCGSPGASTGKPSYKWPGPGRIARKI